MSEEERKQLEAMRTKPRAENRYAERARIILSAAQGCSNKEIARALNTREARVSKWRVRFEREELSVLHDDFRAGRPLEVVENFRELLLTRLDEDPPESFARWNSRLLAKSLGRARIGYGGNCGIWASVCNGDAVGVCQPIRSFRKRRPM